MGHQTKFTPGPWYYAVGEDIYGGEPTNHLWSNVNPNPFILTFNPKHPDIDANASLIAAAPDLLDALISMKEDSESHGIYLESIHKAGIAIEKALNIKK